jgi:hypothetical protein
MFQHRHIHLDYHPPAKSTFRSEEINTRRQLISSTNQHLPTELRRLSNVS